MEGGSPKKILDKRNVFPKKYVELRTFDGMLKTVEYRYRATADQPLVCYTYIHICIMYALLCVYIGGKIAV